MKASSASSEPTSMLVGPSFSSGVFACHQRPRRYPPSNVASAVIAKATKTTTIGIGSSSSWGYIVLIVRLGRDWRGARVAARGA